MTCSLCVAQLNFVVGDLDGNVKKIVSAAHQAHRQGAKLLLTPELSICGYAAEDLFLRPAFIAACDAAVDAVCQQLADLKDMTVVVGHPVGGDIRTRSVAVQSRFNAASVLRQGQVVATYRKRELPNYQVFDERRYFMPGDDVCVFEVGEGEDCVKVGLLICEDAWFEEPANQAKAAGARMPRCTSRCTLIELMPKASAASSPLSSPWDCFCTASKGAMSCRVRKRRTDSAVQVSVPQRTPLRFSACASPASSHTARNTPITNLASCACPRPRGPRRGTVSGV